MLEQLHADFGTAGSLLAGCLSQVSAIPSLKLRQVIDKVVHPMKDSASQRSVPRLLLSIVFQLGDIVATFDRVHREGNNAERYVSFD